MISTVASDTRALKICHHLIRLEPRECLEFIDLTDSLTTLVKESAIWNGILNIQTRHTTTAIIVNENEPLLLEDIKRVLKKLAPRHLDYQHDDFTIRTANMVPGEHKNGHSHCKAIFLKTSETLNIAGGAIQLGQWQRVLFLELDGSRQRTVSVTALGHER